MTTPTEPDPFKNARGLSGMLSQKSGPPLWPFLLAAVGLIGVVALRVELASRESADREAAFEVDGMLANDHSQSAGAGIQLGGSPTTPAELEDKAKRVCTKLGCAGGAAADSVIQDCVRQNVTLGQDPEQRQILAAMLDGVLNACGDKSCGDFPPCYFDHLKGESGALSLPTAPVSEEDRARLKKLVCEVAIETPGHLPDLNSPNASPKAHELSALMTQIGPARAADLMKAAVDECPSPPELGPTGR